MQIDHVVALAAAWVVLPFAAVDARRPGVVEETKRLIEEDGFRGIKLYPPLGYHPNDPLLRPLYAFAAELRDFAADEVVVVRHQCP